MKKPLLFSKNEQKKATKSWTLKDFDKIFQIKHRTNMKISDARARMQDVFSIYHTMIRHKRLGWILKEHEKVVVVHVLSEIRTQSLKDHLDYDFSFFQLALQETSQAF